ncbi:MAG: AzlD domain-containing protein [Actinobacteria bacterium]|nr:AzlD domain-containing protein [Actinomycetota bacterium]
MSLGLIALIALMTYASRALALVAMPHPPERLRVVLDRIPAPLFASLAALSLVEGGGPAQAATLCAAAGALALTPTRSLLYVLAGGLAGYVVGDFLFG